MPDTWFTALIEWCFAVVIVVTTTAITGFYLWAGYDAYKKRNP